MKIAWIIFLVNFVSGSDYHIFINHVPIIQLVILINSSLICCHSLKGSQPVLKALNNEQVICVWENDEQIHASVLEM